MDAANEDVKSGACGPKCFCMGIGPQVTAVAENLWPKSTNDHFRSARVEFLKGLRSLIDERIDKLGPKAQTGKGSAIPVD